MTKTEWRKVDNNPKLEYRICYGKPFEDGCNFEGIKVEWSDLKNKSTNEYTRGETDEKGFRLMPD